MHAPRAVLSFPWGPPGELPGERSHVPGGEALIDGFLCSGAVVGAVFWGM